jgi:hypothetical protein
MPIEYLNFDSFYATKQNNEAFNSTFQILTPYRNIKKVYLKNVEMPVGFTNIRSSNASNVFNFIVNSVGYSASIPEGYYSSISSLLTALNSAIAGVINPLYSMVLTVNSLNHIVITLTLISSPATSVNYSILSTTLSVILGLSTLVNVTNATTSTGSVFNLSYDTYILMNFPNIPSSFNGSNNNLTSTLRIPLNCTPYTVYYYISERTSFDQTLTVNNDTFILSSLQVKLFDRFGYPLYNGSTDFSFTIAIDYDLE